MSDEVNGAEGAEQQLRMNILAQFVRDMSFENNVALKGLQAGDISPEMQVQVSLDAKKRSQDNQYEVISKFKITATNKTDNTTLYLMELDYGGIFHIEGVPEDQLHPFLLIECPRQLFPFVRRIVSDVTRDGGFPPFNLEIVDFVGLYRNELARRQQAEAEV
ncbi:protein-export chaperone SecB [Thioclava sp. BHET1]|uniref:protein-export chaperone SecB n=1 Tax=Thioclava dalianensis TaxID=1185766 RepID=UPI000571E959|nr:protein-export chaperone SecB [Thioclava dalianensis]TMV94081.1 protein-export chaperone SecB [Thioclava sp. BHET1]SFN33120.1 preprotein translocase subunit SecB [Thioclava dalianensis]